jgi:hypothetical protein
MRKQDLMHHNFLQVDSSGIVQSASKRFMQPWRDFVSYGRLQDGAYSRMALTTDQATDLQSPSADLANRASVFDVESLDEALKGLSCLDELRLTEIYPDEWIPKFWAERDCLDFMKHSPGRQRMWGGGGGEGGRWRKST